MRLVSICGSFCMLLLFAALFSCSATNQRRSFRTAASVRDRYDRSVTTFDPSGRLLQVEYAQQAAQRRPSLVVMVAVRDACYILTLSSTVESTMSIRTTPIMHRISECIYFVGVGLLGDIRAVASHLRVQAQQHYYNFDEEWTVSQAATALSNLQHQLTHQSGVRPLGITGFLLGTDAKPYQSTTSVMNNAIVTQSPTAQLFQCSPGGLPDDCLYCCNGAHETELTSMLQEQYPRLQNSTEADIIQALVEMVHSIIIEKSDAPKDDPVFDVCVLRGLQSNRSPVSYFQGLRNAAPNFAKLHDYYNPPTTMESPFPGRD